MLEAKSLRKSYGDIKAVDGVSLRLDRGEILGLLGPNGAGKTSTVLMLAGLLTPDEGEVLIDGTPVKKDTDERKAALGLVPQEIALFDKLTAEDNLRFFGSLYGLTGKTMEEAVKLSLEYAGLTERAGYRVETFSGGMKRRLNLASGLLHKPKVLMLDEPTVGVDPQSRNAIFENLEKLKNEGLAILYTTHYMEEAERLCDRVVIIDHGKVLADDTPSALCNSISDGKRMKLELRDPIEESALVGLKDVSGVVSVKLQNGGVTVAMDRMENAPDILAWFSGNNIPYLSILSHSANLESVFLEMTGRKLRD